MNNTKWRELVRAFLQLEGEGKNKGVVWMSKCKPNGYVYGWEGTWTHFLPTDDRYDDVEWLKIRFPEEHRDMVLATLRAIHVPGEVNSNEVTVYGYEDQGVDYINFARGKVNGLKRVLVKRQGFSVVFIGKRGLNLLCLLLLFALLAGCGDVYDAGSSSKARDTTTSSSVAAPASSSTPTFVDGTPVGKEALSMLEGSWFHDIDGQYGGMIYLFKFDEQPGQLLVSKGFMDTDDGNFYSGPYQWESDGQFTAEMNEKRSGYEKDNTFPIQNISFAIEWAGNECRQVRITLFSSGSMSDAFLEDFGDILDKPLLYENMFHYRYYG